MPFRHVGGDRSTAGIGAGINLGPIDDGATEVGNNRAFVAVSDLEAGTSGVQLATRSVSGLPMVTPAVPSPFTTTLELVVPTATLKVPDTGAVMVVGVVAPVLGSVTTNVWPLVAVALAPAVGCTASAIETGVTA